ncbi:MAG: tetratricopeptide repeat protein [Candidatus Latescibacter sp.]|nr:tetratricopeptide repeat protein [Candidatus Latescibacter sp.]
MTELVKVYTSQPMIVLAGVLALLLAILMLLMIRQFLKNRKLKTERDETDLAAVELVEDVLKDVPTILDTHSMPVFQGNSEKAAKIISLLHERNLISPGLFLKLAVIEYLEGYISKALRHAENALELGEKAKNQAVRAIALGNMGIMYYEKGDLDRALKNLLDALAVCRENGLKEYEAGNLRHLGQVHKRRNDSEMGLDFAMKYFTEALELDRLTANRAGEAQDLVQIGLIFLDSGNMDAALTYFNDALVIHRETENSPGEAQDLGNIGLIHQIKGDLDAALRCLKKALEIHESIGSRRGESQSLGNIGLIYQTRGELDLALEYHTDALEIDRELGDRRGEGQDLGSIGIIHYKKGDLPEALTHLRQALAIFEETGVMPDKEAVESTISEIEAKM